MSEQLFTLDDVAGRLDVSPSILEHWCVIFANCLSIPATPPDEPLESVGTRLFTQEDVAVLAKAKQLLGREVVSRVDRNRDWS